MVKKLIDWSTLHEWCSKKRGTYYCERRDPDNDFLCQYAKPETCPKWQQLEKIEDQEEE